jgi:hypothetical protein
MVFSELFRYIEWNICHEPTAAINTNTKTAITNEELDSIVKLQTITDGEVEFITAIFPMGVYHNYSDTPPLFITKYIQIPKVFTLRQLLTHIYNFYQESLLSGESITNPDPKFHISLQKMKEIKKLRQNIVNAHIVNDPFYDESTLKNINVFTEVTLPKFCGISYGEYTHEYWILIKI